MNTHIESAAETLGSPDSANVAWSKKGMWSFYEFIIPINFLRSIEETFALADPISGGDFLDIGCGSGLGFERNVAWIRGSGRWTAVDPDPLALQHCKIRAQRLDIADRVRLARLRAEELEHLGSAEFDGAYAHFSLYAISGEENRRRAVASAFHVLRPGARFACAVPGQRYNRHALVEHARNLERARSDISVWQRWKRNWINYTFLKAANKMLDEQLDRDAMHRYSREELMEHFHSAGFEDVTCRHVDGFNAYQIVGTRPRRSE